MDSTFATIGLEVPSEKAFSLLAERAGDQGEATQLLRRGAVLHGRCWKLGEGLEVWTVLYESGTGEVFYADCRPGFRARYTQRITPWALTEYDEAGEAVIHGYCEGTETEVLFELQNLTEISPSAFQSQSLCVGLCGLAYRARVRDEKATTHWKSLETIAPQRAVYENDWSLCGRVISYKTLQNPLSGSELYWAYLDLSDLKLEVLINAQTLRGGSMKAGAMISAEVWLQGHIIDETALRSRYEGVDYSYRNIDFWTKFKRHN
jgi:hypothetical protein